MTEVEAPAETLPTERVLRVVSSNAVKAAYKDLADTFEASFSQITETAVALEESGRNSDEVRGRRRRASRVAPPRSARARLSSAPVDAHARSRVARAIIVRPRPPRDPQIRARPSAPDASPPSAPDSPAPPSPPPAPAPLQLAAHLESLIETRARHHVRRENLNSLDRRYECTTARTDFATGLDAPEDAQQLSRRVAQSPSYANLDPSPDAARATFRDAVAAARRRHAGAPDDGEDADVIVTQAGGRGGASSGSGVPGFDAPNAKCPLSQRALADLADPVKDKAGYVYDRSAIEQYINAQARRRGPDDVRCPVSGTAHVVRIEELAPASDLLRAVKRQRALEERARAGGKKGRGGRDASDSDEDVY